MKSLPSGIVPRCLTHEEAAAYCRLEVSGFDSWVARALIPGPIPGTRRWDRKALDRAIDILSNLPTDTTTGAEADLAAWREGRNANAA